MSMVSEQRAADRRREAAWLSASVRSELAPAHEELAP